MVAVAHYQDFEAQPLEIFGTRLQPDAPGFADAVAQAYAARRRPRCLCRPEGVEMYVAKLGDGYIVKRMPETGSQHAPGCPSYEGSTEASGRGLMLGLAIREDPGTGLTALRLDFSLSHGAGRSAVPSFEAEASTARSRGSRLSLRGLLHYLWDQAGLTRWQPGFAGKRSWGVVRRRLREATSSHTANGQVLQDRLYVPEPFAADQWEGIRARRSAQWAAVTEGPSIAHPRMLLVAELKELASARHGYKATVKHAPDLGFMLDERLFRQVGRRFERQLALWGASDDIRMVVIGTFSLTASGVPLLGEVSLMPATRDWIPVESAFEKMLIERLIADERCFLKGLRYDLRAEVPLAAATLLDCGNTAPLLCITSEQAAHPSACHPSRPADEVRWQWLAQEEPMPMLPPPSRMDSRFDECVSPAGASHR
ncbi:DUF1173 family protein [Roseateles sp. P5_E11]